MSLSCNISKNKTGSSLRIEGDVIEICSDTSVLLTNIYSELYRVSPYCGDLFKYMVTRCVTDPESPTWVLREPQEGDVRIAVQKPKDCAEAQEAINGE